MKTYIKHLYWLIKTWPNRRHFPKYKVMTVEETIKDIVTDKKSIARLGDGEFLLLLNVGSIGFQVLDKQLSNKLKEVLSNRNPQLLIAVPDSIATTKSHKIFAKTFWLKFINYHGKALSKFLDKDYNYGNTNISRLYVGIKNQSQSKNYFNLIKTLWHDKDILIIEGYLSRLGVGNDLFENARSLERIICPNKDAFDKYEFIKLAAREHGKEKLIILALGPTATVLCSELCNEGFWAIDIGHIDVEYMWMLMNAKERVPIKGRFVNESNNSEGYDLDSELAEPYNKSIILDLSH